MTLDTRTATSVTANDACVVFGRKTEEIVRSLEEASRLEARVGALRGPDSASLTKFIGYLIDKHHVYARRQAAAIAALLARLSAAHEQCRPELARVRSLFEVLRRELLFHMEKEEVSLFPRIIQTEAAATRGEPREAAHTRSARDPIRMSMDEHDGLCAMLDEIRAATNDYAPPRGACADYRTLCRALRDLELDLLHLIYLEDRVLFPRALEMERRA
ncbi:MAG TPA: hemerythrin domain-containing protein [Pyrinomonadaceae bacterium]